MKRLAPIVALALPAWLGAAAQLRNLTFDVPLDTVYSGQVAVSHFEIMTAPGTQAYFAVAVAPGASVAPGSTADWVIDQVGTYNSSKAAPTNACPQTGYPGPTQGLTRPDGRDGLLQDAELRVLRAQEVLRGGLRGAADGRLLVPGRPVAGLQRQRLGMPHVDAHQDGHPPASTPTATPTAGAATSTATPTAGTPPATPTRTPTAAPAAPGGATGPAAEPIKVVRAIMFPNPNPSRSSSTCGGPPRRSGSRSTPPATPWCGRRPPPGRPPDGATSPCRPRELRDLLRQGGGPGRRRAQVLLRLRRVLPEVAVSEIPRIDEVENIARMVRLNLAKDGYLAQVAFLWSGPNVAIIRSRPLRDARDKATWAAVLRRTCVQLEADTVLNVMEIFAAPAPANASMDDLMGPVEGRTGAYEAILFHLESMDGTWSCVVPIVRSPGQPPSFPMPRFWTRGRVDGLLANFIPDKRSGAYGG